MNKRRSLAALAALALTLTGAGMSGTALAQSDYPNRPVRIIVGYSAGGPTDAVARVLAESLGKELKQPVIVENRPGGNGAVSAQIVMAAPPDGYTLMLGSSGALAIAPVYKEKLPYDVQKNFTPVALVAGYPYLLVVPPNSPIKSLPDLIEKAKARPGQINYATAGAGSVNHLATEWVASANGVRFEHIPYKGDSAIVPDLLAGRIDFAFISAVTVLPQVKSGKMKALAITSATPSKLAEGVPPVATFGIPDFSAEPWNGILGPAHLPPEIVRKLNLAITEVMNRPETRERLTALGQYPVTGTAEEFRKHIEVQTARWAEVIRKGNIPREP